MMQRAPEPRRILREIALHALRERGLVPDFPFDALAEANALREDTWMDRDGAPVQDLRQLPWLSIDNEGARTLDQITAAEARGPAVRLLVAIADVDALVPSGSALDRHARHNTRSVYTPAGTFPVLPERVANDLGSLRKGKDRPAVVVEMTVEADGSVSSPEIRRARVCNQAQLTYEQVAESLTGKSGLPKTALKRSLLRKQIQLHVEAAGRLRRRRYERGALPIERWRLDAVFHCDDRVRLTPPRSGPAQELIEDLMVATNEVTAAFLAASGLPSLRRLVEAPVRWPRLVQLAAGHGEALPLEPDSAALAAFLESRRTAEPERYPELAYAVLQLVGPGEYRADLPGRPLPRHFSLAADDYTHSTAPNRRYADLVTQRLLKAALAGLPSPYSGEELEELAGHCTRREDDAAAVERRVEASAGALLLADRVGETFEAVLTSLEGARIRLCEMPVEGVLDGLADVEVALDVGDRLRVRLERVDVEAGILEFVR
jgi:exoribonuclease II